MSIACAAGGIAAGGRLLLLLLLRWLVVVGVCEDQTLRGRGGRWFSSSTHRLLQQRGEIQTSTENSWLGQLQNDWGRTTQLCPACQPRFIFGISRLILGSLDSRKNN